jgi:hypothetical protein
MSVGRVRRQHQQSDTEPGAARDGVRQGRGTPTLSVTWTDDLRELLARKAVAAK